MKQFIYLLSFLLSTAVLADPVLDSCCICILGEHADSNTAGQIKRECDTWLRRTSKSIKCDLKTTYHKDDVEELETQKNSCGKITVWGAFHGNSKAYSDPFLISKQLAKSYQAKEVCYDGSSCLVFDNISDVKRMSSYLAETDENTKYIISGNQNMGTVCEIPFLLGPREVHEFASKVMTMIEKGGYTITYSKCSKKGEQCMYSDGYVGSDNDPNAKWCMNDTEVVSQHCCPKNYSNNKKLDETIGTWSAPSVDCH